MTQRNENIIERAITKRNFNVVLDIYNTASWTGKQFNPIFQVDLKRLVQNPQDLAKPYKINIFVLYDGRAICYINYIYSCSLRTPY